jgi:hypothetical protein
MIFCYLHKKSDRLEAYNGLYPFIRRAYAEQPDLELINDVDGEQFIARFPRIIKE